MATITGLTAARMLAIEAASIVAGMISGDNLILTRHDGTTLDAGSVRGPQGPQGIPGSISVSPAGGVLAGNYPNPSLSPGAVGDVNVAAANKDGAADVPSMRTLGTGAVQAAAGNHVHSTDTGWVNFTPAKGDIPFASTVVVRAQYRKIGKLVSIRFVKDSTAARDENGNASGNFANVNVIPVGGIPVAARPEQTVVVAGRMDDSYVGLAVRPDGSLVWHGGTSRLYAAGSELSVDVMFFVP